MKNNIQYVDYIKSLLDEYLINDVLDCIVSYFPIYEMGTQNINKTTVREHAVTIFGKARAKLLFEVTTKLIGSVLTGGSAADLYFGLNNHVDRDFDLVINSGIEGNDTLFSSGTNTSQTSIPYLHSLFPGSWIGHDNTGQYESRRIIMNWKSQIFDLLVQLPGENVVKGFDLSITQYEFSIINNILQINPSHTWITNGVVGDNTSINDRTLVMSLTSSAVSTLWDTGACKNIKKRINKYQERGFVLNKESVIFMDMIARKLHS